MINSMQAAIIKKDLRGIIFNKRLFPVLLIVPIVLTVVMPSIFIMAVHFAPEDTNDFQQMIDMLPIADKNMDLSTIIINLLVNNIMPVFFILIPIMASSVMAASSFVGEKEKRTLETLLYCPLTLKQILQSKIYASFVMSMLVSFSSFFVMLIVIETEIFLTTGSLLTPNISWLIIMLVISPAISLISIKLIVQGSAKAQTVEEAQQRSVFLVIPIILLIVGQFTGIILINIWVLLIIGILLAFIAFLLIKGSYKQFSYEFLLK